jgi:GTPase SAR1 family protein
MKLSQLREVKELSNELDLDFKELTTAFIDKETDFEIENYRFISFDTIDEVQQDELKSDLYILGCFNAWFIADNTNLSIKVVEALQKAEAFEELGELMVDNIEEIQSEYASADGYGHHFNHYDGNEWEINIDGVDYYYFRTN